MHRFRIFTLLAVLLIAAAVVATATARKTQSPPSPSQLGANVAAASAKQTSAHYVVNGTFVVKGVTASSGSSTQILPGLNASALASKPIKLNVEGDIATGPKQQLTAATAKGSVMLGGQPFNFQVLATESQLYLNLLGVWYGSKTQGIKSVTQQVPGASGTTPTTTNPGDLAQAFTGTVTDGPQLDGVDTWELTGTLNPDGLAAIAKKQGKSSSVTPAQIADLKLLAPALKLTVDVGKNDSLVRRVHVTLNLTKDMIKAIAKSGQSGSTSLNGLTSLSADVTVDISNWGEKVSITPPSSYQPLAKLLGGLLGGSIGGTTKKK
jgi:hypothetical protein